jgi:CheY-like chemotaxis protein
LEKEQITEDKGPMTKDKGPMTLSFEVSDTGYGIARNEMEALFEPFVQTSAGQQVKIGTGLGIPISRQFVEVLGGDLTVDSAGVRGQGSRFSFSIPVTVAEPIAVEAKAPARRVVALETDQPTYRILIVEDNPDNRRLLVKLLQPLGFELQEAENGQEAINLVESRQPHLIWMDLRMPVMDGYETTRRIKATPQGQGIVIIALTASAFEEERAGVLATGCDDYVRKPFREHEIFDMLHKHLGVRFIYEDVIEPTAVPEVMPTEVAPDALAMLPPDLLAKLKRATASSDMELISATLAEIRNHNASLVEALEVMAIDFEYEGMLVLIEAAEEMNLNER